MTPRRMQVGINRRIPLEWSARTASLLLEQPIQPKGYRAKEIRTHLNHYLEDRRPNGERIERGKRSLAQTVSILMRTWVNVPAGLEAFRDDGLKHLQRLPVTQHLPVHWGMFIAVYPFFGIVAEAVGRLLHLQRTVALAQIQRRIHKQLGERSTVTRATRRMMRNLIDWDVLQETKIKGIYRAGPTHPISDPQLGPWLLEAVLLTSDTTIKAKEALTQSPILFPFRFEPTALYTLNSAVRLDIFRQGLDQDMVMLR